MSLLPSFAGWHTDKVLVQFSNLFGRASPSDLLWFNWTVLAGGHHSPCLTETKDVLLARVLVAVLFVLVLGDSVFLESAWGKLKANSLYPLIGRWCDYACLAALEHRQILADKERDCELADRDPAAALASIGWTVHPPLP